MTPQQRLIQIIQLQTDRVGARALDSVNHFRNFTVRQRAGRFDEDSFLDSRIFRRIRAVEQFIPVNVILLP